MIILWYNESDLLIACSSDDFVWSVCWVVLFFHSSSSLLEDRAGVWTEAGLSFIIIIALKQEYFILLAGNCACADRAIDSFQSLFAGDLFCGLG